MDNILTLKLKAKKNNIPDILVNENFGIQKTDFHFLTKHCIKEKTLGKEITENLLPNKEDYFVFKP